jgi:RHS repeat-associated protein
LVWKLNTWKDQLTKIEYYVNGTLSYTQTLSYDSSGNVTSILDTRSSYLTINFEWNGRDLTRRQQYSSITQMKYDDQGIRTYKNSGGVTTTYTLNGYLVLLEKIGTITIYYTYDQQGALLSMNYNGTEFFYITNLQGDIIEMVDINGNTVVKYRYDAWGNIIYSWYDTGLGYNLATINPYRYRGYRYDNDLKLYYLQSRYYDPSIGRFINADSVNYLDPSGYTGLNLYAYCGNNPVMFTDSTGHAREYWYIAVGLVAVLAIATVITCGGAGVAFAAIGYASQGITLVGLSTTATVFAYATAGSAGALAAVGMFSAMSSSSIEEFDDSGGIALAMTATGGLVGGYIGYLATRPSFYRAMSAAEVQAVKDSGYLRGGKEGQTFFTNTPYYSSGTAQSHLSLPTSPDYMMQFRISNNPNIYGPQTVRSIYGYNGGGVEFYTYDRVKVIIESIWRLK